MLELIYFRWWEVLVETPVAFKQVVVVNHHRHLHPWVLQKYWLHKLICFAKSSKRSDNKISSSEVDGNDYQPQSATYSDFLGTQPPLFNRTEEPLDSDAWIKTIVSKSALLTVTCSEANKARFVAQQLHGSTSLWQNHYNVMLPADHVVTWDEFKIAFRAHHIPEGLMDRKLNEFLALTQGTRTVMQYAQAFN